MPERIEKDRDAEQGESDSIVEEMLLVHSQQSAAGELRDPSAQKREKGKPNQKSGDVYKRRSQNRPVNVA